MTERRVARAAARALPLAWLAWLSMLACGQPPRARAPLVVVGVDGGDRKVVEALWAEGELPALRRLADQGSFQPLRTSYGKSPVIWTTIATGVRPEQHGIEDFVVATPQGDVPVTSATRRRPALWNLLARVERRSAVLGWWATWPAEEVPGSLVVSDRAGLGLESEISPAERAPDLERWVAAARQGGPAFGGNEGSELHDRIVALAAVEAVREPFDLVLAYFRSVDVVCHWQWHTFQRELFPDGPPAGVAPSISPTPVRDAYRAFDEAIAALVAAAPAGTSWLVVSDHGFRAERGEEVAIHLDFDRVLEATGFLVRTGGQVDAARSLARTHSSPPFRQTKLVRLREDLPEVERRRTTARLTAALGRVRFPDGSAAFAPRPPTEDERARGAELAVPVIARALWDRVELDGRVVAGAVQPVARLTGSHDEHTAGILLASGPLFAPGARTRQAHVHDLAPTILYALGLPVAEDFAGQARTGLFRSEFVAANPVRRIASWGESPRGETPASARDRELLDELAALGYLR